MNGISVDLSGQVAIVTGAGGGLGRAFSLALARSGAKIIAADFNKANADATVAALRAASLDAESFVVDVTNEAQTKALSQFAIDAFGRIDILVNNAAFMEPVLQPLLDYSMETARRTMDVNFFGPLLCIRAVAAAMKANGYGRIVNISSGGAYASSHVYGASKLALNGLTSYLAGEMGRDNITVNAIAPGMMLTAQGNKARENYDSDALAPMIPLKAYGDPEDLVGALLFLCSRGADWITGEIIRVDGGWIKSVL